MAVASPQGQIIPLNPNRNEALKTRKDSPMTARSSSWGFCLFGSVIWASTAFRTLGSGPFRMKCSKNLKNTGGRMVNTLTWIIVWLFLTKLFSPSSGPSLTALPPASQPHTCRCSGSPVWLSPLSPASQVGQRTWQPPEPAWWRRPSDSPYHSLGNTYTHREITTTQRTRGGLCAPYDLRSLPVSSLPASTFLMKAFRLPFLQGPSMGRMAFGPNDTNEYPVIWQFFTDGTDRIRELWLREKTSKRGQEAFPSTFR